MPVLSPSEDIKSLIERHTGIQVVGKAARVRGDLEYHSNCPWCGGHDRFITRPETGWYTCAIRASGCGRKGDMLDFLREYCFMSMTEAVEEIGMNPADLDFVVQERAQERTLAWESPPGEQWRKQAETWLHTLRVKQTLFHPVYAHALKHVGDRGLKNESIRRFDLQYFPLFDGSWRQEDAEMWGLDANDYKDGQIKLPEGIWIPWYRDKQLWKIEVRRLLGVKGDIRYMVLDGSGEHVLYNVDAVQSDKPVVLCESALCAVVGTQECGDVVTFVATGGAGKGQDEKWVKCLEQVPCVLVAFDDDDVNDRGVRPGDEGAQFWLGRLSRAMRWLPWKKDVSDMSREGMDIRGWVMSGLDAYELLQSAKTWSMSDPYMTLARTYIATLRTGQLPPDRPDFGQWEKSILDIEHLFMDHERECRGVEVLEDWHVEPKWKPTVFENALAEYAQAHPEALVLYEPGEVEPLPQKKRVDPAYAGIIERVEFFQELGVRFAVVDGRLVYESEWGMSAKVCRFLDEYAGVIVEWLQ